MAVVALTSFIVKAWIALSIASLVSFASAADDDASTTPTDLTNYLAQWKMALVIETPEIADNSPGGVPFDVVPLTSEAGLQPDDVKKLPDVKGDLVILDYSNFTQVNYTDKVVFLCCDGASNNDSNLISPDRVLNAVMSNSAAPAAILLYSKTKPICFLGGRNLPYSRIWTMASQDDAAKVHSFIATTDSDTCMASIMRSSVAPDNQQQGRPGSTSAIAMSILYAITGLITLLFLFIIATGAVRAHRNPERYGPRPSANGRPRRSRARGLAMAMLETLPIVKFGENDQRKPDEENALENVNRVESQTPDASRDATNDTSNNATVPESSSEAADHAASQREQEGAPATTGSTQNKADKEPENEEDHLQCSICTEDFTKGEDVRVLPCDHKFHPACVDPWLVNVSGTCPLCRLDLRPPEDAEGEEDDTPATQDAAPTAGGLLAPPPDTREGNAPESAAAADETHRRRRSRLFDWNRLRHASVDERLQALRQYRQSQQASDGAADDERRHSRLTDRLRERLHIRSESRSNATTPEPPAAPASTVQTSLPPASTQQH
ncbi:hypothetical protein F5B22DRAFT_647989 [Xylaria bambusicola]|uniref:uncharacterized protein n=1 Tax=Xylaria bambusicola TaxID=326684 RepID=UPI002007D0B6|nr:uncharacterized protein F5B22DRAFT_647989 [Xylaria bambusicola]KAI0513176.1 hypothetical protein F5B22DRAFT_647989 [Xylaria bambusicola]